MDNITKIKFEEWQNETYDDGELWAGHYGQVLQVEGLTLPDGHIEVHFSLTEHTGDAHPYIGTVKDNVIEVDIPDFIFQKENIYDAESYEAYAFIYQTDENSGQTIKKITFTIKARPNVTTNVPEDQKDPFLDEVRKVMAETKEIAQSVREDADKGVFDGEKGEKGDAGSIKFKIVPTLPTEDFDASIMYLVPSPTEEDKNRYLEYVFIDGKPEIIGSATVEVNLDDYVKNTDYASNSIFGLVVGNPTFGINIEKGKMYVQRAVEEEIDKKESAYKTITPSKLDYAVMKALSDSKLEWTDEQKQLARVLLGIPDYDSNYGISMLNGKYVLVQATNVEIDAKGSATKIISPYRIDYAVMKALTDPKNHEWTEEEKASALALLGALKRISISGYPHVYGENANGQCGFELVPNEAKPWTIPQRGADGVVTVGTPTEGYHATPKKYVDDGFVAKQTVDRTSVYAVDKDGNQVVIGTSPNAANNGMIPVYNGNGNINASIPTGDNHVANKKYVDEEIAELRAEIDALKG